MKQKVTITLTIEPRELGYSQGNALNAVMATGSMLLHKSPAHPPWTKFRVQCGKVVRFYSRGQRP